MKTKNNMVSHVTYCAGLSVLTSVTSSIVISTVVVVGNIDTNLSNRLFEFLNVNHEGNFPTWLSSTLLTLNGLGLLVIAYIKRQMAQPYFLNWLVLGIIFFFLSLDETASLHESSISTLRDVLGTGGFLYYAWIIPAAILVVVLGLLYLPFLFHLPRYIQKVFSTAAALYLSGALCKSSKLFGHKPGQV